MDSEWLTYLTEDWSADFENGLRETDRGFQTSSCAWVMALQRRLLSRPEAQMRVSRTMDHMSSRPRSCWPRGEFPGEETLSFLWLMAFWVSLPEWGRAVRLMIIKFLLYEAGVRRLFFHLSALSLVSLMILLQKKTALPPRPRTQLVGLTLYQIWIFFLWKKRKMTTLITRKKLASHRTLYGKTKARAVCDWSFEYER